MKAASLHMAILMALIVLASCAPNEPAQRQVSPHHSGQFTAVGDQDDVGMMFWACQRAGDRFVCDRVCYDESYEGRICAPHLHHEFGRVSRSSAALPKARRAPQRAGEEQ